MRVRLPSAVLVLTAVAGACAGAGGEAGSGQGLESPEGCYRFQDTAAARELGLPWGVVLDGEALAGGWGIVNRFDDVRRARTATSATGRADHPFGYWRPVAADSVELGHPGGGGLVLVVAPTDGGLAGRGRSAGDALQPGQAPGPRPGYEVRAERIACEP